MDEIGKMLGGVSGGGSGGDIVGALGGLVGGEGGLQGLVEQLGKGGLGDTVSSWVSTGANRKVEPAALGSALGQDHVDQLAAKSGLPVDQLLPVLASALPSIVDGALLGGNKG